MKPIAYGIDFGTTNSVLAVAYDDRVEVMPGLSDQTLRSVIYLDASGTYTAGEQSLQQFLVRPDVSRARPMLELKALLADESFSSTDVFGRHHSLEQLVSIVFRYLKLVGDRATGSDVTRAVIGFPVAFPEALGDRFGERQDLALERLCRAANEAGFTDVVPLEEPAAAASGEDAETYVALDFGGGTFDVAVVRQDASGADVLALAGAPIGGESFTKALFASKVVPALGLDHPRMPVRHVNAATSLAGVLHALFEDDLPLPVLREFAPDYAAFLAGGFLYQLYDAVEQAKRELSEKDAALIQPQGRGLDLAVEVKRDEFEELVAADLDRTMDEVQRALRSASIPAGSVDLVTLTGGSSSIPSFRSRVDALFPDAKIEARDPYGRVAAGLAEQARWIEW